MRPTSRILVEKAILTQILSLINILIPFTAIKCYGNFHSKFHEHETDQSYLVYEESISHLFCISDPSPTFSKRWKDKNVEVQLLPRLPKLLIYSMVKISFTETCDPPNMDG